RRYLSEFLSDKRVVDYPRWFWLPLLQLVILSKRPFTSGSAYQSIWNTDANESPLLTVTKAQTAKIAEKMQTEFGTDMQVEFCMRYGNPSIESVLQRMTDQGCERILFFPLYPQYAAPTTATANDQAFRVLMKMNRQPSIRTVPAYYNDQSYIAALVNSIREAYDAAPTRPEKLVVSYHGVPERHVSNGDPYYHQCIDTTRLLRDALGWDETMLVTTFQSKFGPEKWVGPATVDFVAELAREGVKNVAVVAPAFSADCIETLEEINEEICHSFKEAGGQGFAYIPCLNDRDDHIEALCGIIKNELSGWI
ncbi:MAG: ferrochelatase, partial [Rhodobacteraceae bacterium]|nr:ferrochelatase [Paracoccaceae bacterium]